MMRWGWRLVTTGRLERKMKPSRMMPNGSSLDLLEAGLSLQSRDGVGSWAVLRLLTDMIPQSSKQMIETFELFP